MECKEVLDYPDYVEVDGITHMRQRYNWDCGVTCVMMVMPAEKKEHLLNNFHEVCKDEGFNKSTWTIDLSYLLNRYKIPHLYTTVTLGIHPGYRRQTFYDKILHKDEDRITKRFSEAKERGIPVRKASLTCEDFIKHLAARGPIILLTNASLLHCDNCKVNLISIDLMSCLPWAVPYHGHYIVLCGYNLPKRRFLYRNPSFKKRMCSISFKSLNEARKSYGTDEDAILIFSKGWTNEIETESE